MKNRATFPHVLEAPPTLLVEKAVLPPGYLGTPLLSYALGLYEVASPPQAEWFEELDFQIQRPTILGHLEDITRGNYRVQGYNLLHCDPWTWQKNLQFLCLVEYASQPIKLATPIPRRVGVFYEEYLYFLSRGWCAKESCLYPPSDQ